LAVILNFAAYMKKILTVLLIIVFTSMVTGPVFAQCAMCTKTAQQLGEKPAEGLNSGILYLMAAPLALMGVIGYRWWKSNHTD
jgi:hypothetical protein